MNITDEAVNDVKIIRLSGRFDNYIVPLVNEWLSKNISEETHQIIVNLSKVHFIDSTALATLVQAMNLCHKYQGDLHLCSLQPQVLMIFELTRLDKAFNIFIDEDHASSAFTI